MGKPITQPVRLERAGQRFYDEPIYEQIAARADLTTPIARAVGSIFGSAPRGPLRQLVGYERTRLNWLKGG